MNENGEAPIASAWGAVFAIAVTVAALLTSEFLPASLLTPMARDLGLTEGMAGQAVTATAMAAMIASLLVVRLARGIDRRVVMMTFAALLTGSNLLVALAPGFAVMLVGRILLGFALGGFWAMSASIAMRLAAPADVPKTLSIVFSGVSIALVIAAPIGSFFGAIIGWRGVFLAAAALGAVCWLWQFSVLPAMPAGDYAPNGLWRVAKRPGVAVAMTAIFFVFAGQFAVLTYMRPFYESVTGLTVNRLSAMLLLFGAATFVGNSLAAPLVKANLKFTLAGAPLVMALTAAALVLFGGSPIVTAGLTALYGLLFGTVPVGWSTWITAALPDDAENAGGLEVAVIQLANTLGAGLGGVVLDAGGARQPFVVAGALLLSTAVLVAAGVRAGPPVASRKGSADIAGTDLA